MKFKECFKYIVSDFYRYSATDNKLKLLKFFLSNRFFRFQCYLRLSKLDYFGLIFCFLKSKSSVVTGNQISKKVLIGEGLYIPHGNVVINATAVIGKNVSIMQFTSVGSIYGKSATIGDNVYVGPNVSIVEDVNIGNNVVIGAGSVIVKDIENDSVAVGVPGRVIHNSHQIITNCIQNKCV